MEYNNLKVAHECGPGWKYLIDKLVDECDKLGGRVDQIKEKMGFLRFYYTPLGLQNMVKWDEFEDMVDMAEAESAITCEMCGKAGVLYEKAGWQKTLCKDDALQLGYRKKV